MALLDTFLLDPAPFDIWIAYRTDGIKGSGTLNDPWDGSSQARFDALMNQFAGVGVNTKVQIHLGPGTFLTRGYSDDDLANSWQAKPGMKIVGAGIDVTILKLINTALSNTRVFAIGHVLSTGTSPVVPNPVDFFEVSDLTIDCNLAAQTGTAMACGAIRIMGHHSRIRRVKAINWGTNSTSKSCYVISTITGDYAASVLEVVDCGIEECIADQPGSSPTGAKVNVLHAGAKDDTATSKETFGKAPFIRNCFVEGPGLGFNVIGLSMGSCRIGIVEGNQVYNLQTGGPFQGNLSTRDIVVRNNFYKNVMDGPLWNLGTLSASAALTSLTRSGATATATTNASPTVEHRLAVGEKVKITATPADFSGVFEITAVPQPNQFQYVYVTPPAQTSASTASMEKVYGIGKVLVEGNVIEVADVNGQRSPIRLLDFALVATPPPYVHGEAIIKNNKIRYVDGVFPPTYPTTAIEVNGTKNVVVRDNILEMGQANPILNRRCGPVKYFNNKSPDGVLIQGYNTDTSRKYDELETEAEDALVLALLQH